MTSATSTPSRFNYKHLRHDEPVCKKGNTRWHRQLNEYCSDIAKLAQGIAKGAYFEQSAQINQDLDKVEKHASSKKAKKTIQDTRNLLVRAEKAGLQWILNQKIVERPKTWHPTPISTFKGTLLSALAFMSSFVSTAANPTEATPEPDPTASFHTPDPSQNSGVIVSVDLGDQFGDQLFQTAAAHVYARDIGAKAVLPSDRALNPVLSKVQRFQGTEPTLPIIQDNGSPLPKDHSQSVKIQGFFQSPKYFEHRKQEIIELFSPTAEMRGLLQAKYPVLHQDTVAIHIHKGDYSSFKLGNDRVMHDLASDIGYYEEALKHFDGANQHFVIISDDIEFARNLPIFKGLNHVQFIEGGESPEAFQVMSLCKNHVTANHPFSWWGAYVGECPGQKVVMPAKWWHPDVGHKWNDPQAEYRCGHYGLLKTDWIIAGKDSPFTDQAPQPMTDKPCSGVLISAILENGLGNQMFQVANAYAHALDIGAEAVFPNAGVEHVGNSPVLSYIERFDGPMPKLPWMDKVEPTAEQSGVYRGLFQSPKYFQHRRKDLLKLFRAPPEVSAHLQEKYRDLLSQNTVAVHIRRGNYLEFRIDGKLVLNNLSEDGNYYEEALLNFDPENQHFVIFSNDLEFAQNMPALQKLKHVTFITGQEAHEDFYLMSMCKNHIIANSTFSWWAAYLGQDPNKKVVAPLNWWHPEISQIWSPDGQEPCSNHGIIPADWVEAGKNCQLPSKATAHSPAPIPPNQAIVSATLDHGVGNQMFQAAAAIALALDEGGQAIFTRGPIAHIHGDSPILSKLKRFDGAQPELTDVPERYDGTPLPKDPNSAVKLQGKFQHTRYFHHRRKEIAEVFSPSPEIRASLQEKYSDLLSKDTVAVHVRRGDTVNDPFLFNLSESDYYEKAIQQLGQDKHYVIFSDDIEFTRNMQAFKGLPNVTFISGQQAHEDFYLMSMCKNHVTANSAFSWWAAYLGEQPGQKVVMPERWWRPEIGKQWNDPNARYPSAHYGLLMDDWIKA